MVRHTLKVLQHLLQDFKNVSDYFTTLQSKGLILSLMPVLIISNHRCDSCEESERASNVEEERINTLPVSEWDNSDTCKSSYFIQGNFSHWPFFPWF